MNVLVVSKKCTYSPELVKFINSNDALKGIVRIHDINVSGVPKGVQRVPTLICKDGKMIIGGDIKTYLEDFIPTSVDFHSNSNLGFSIDGDDGDSMFSLNSYGQSLQPKMTKELEEKISMSVEEAYKKMKV